MESATNSSLDWSMILTLDPNSPEHCEAGLLEPEKKQYRPDNTVLEALAKSLVDAYAATSSGISTPAVALDRLTAQLRDQSQRYTSFRTVYILPLSTATDDIVGEQERVRESPEKVVTAVGPR